MRWPNSQYRKPELTLSKNRTGAHIVDHFKKITPSELSYRREKRFCFKYAEPYTLRHVCKQAHIHYILADKSVGIGETQEGQGANTKEFYDCPESELSNENIEVSIHALAGGSQHKTIKLMGRLAGREVTILVDSGSTHYFDDERLVETLQLQAIGTPLTVNVTNGEKLESR